MISTANLQTEQKMERKTSIAILFERNKETFKKLGVTNPYFTIKMPFLKSGLREHVIGFFPSELSKEDDVYIELTNRDNIPVNETATLYKLAFNPHYKTEYEEDIDPVKGPSSLRYLVPVAKLELVDVWTTPIVNQEFELPQREEEGPNEYKDCHISELTARDQVCIKLRIPESNKEWINDLIKKSTKLSK
jgi:hypothetical protein